MILTEIQKDLLRAFAEGFRDGIVVMDGADQLEDIWVTYYLPVAGRPAVDINLWIPEPGDNVKATVYPCTMGADGYLTTDCQTILVDDLFAAV